MNVSVLGVGTTKFGELWDRSPRSLVREAVELAITDAQIDPYMIEALYVGNMLSGILGNQEQLGALFREELDLGNIAAVKVEGACASGGLAVHQGTLSVLSGMYGCVLVVGIEKMTDHAPNEVASALVAAGSESERTSGATFAGLYALMARAHIHNYRTREEDLALVAVKNHYHASLNPNAQFKSVITIEHVLKSPKIAEPLKLLDCSPISDGASAVILTNNKQQITNNKNHVNIIASTVATDTIGLAAREYLTELKATQVAAKKAYSIAQITPKDIDVAEVHDCFTIAEIMAMEDLGLYDKGKAVKALRLGETTLRGKGPIVNTSGGLKACGHPVGATGVKQIAEITLQLRGKAGDRQVEGARIGLTHNVGGSGGTAVVHILTNA